MNHSLFISKKFQKIIILNILSLFWFLKYGYTQFLDSDLVYFFLNINFDTLIVCFIFPFIVINVYFFAYVTVLKRPIALVSDYGITFRFSPIRKEIFVAWSNISEVRRRKVLFQDTLVFKIKYPPETLVYDSRVRNFLCFLARSLSFGFWLGPLGPKRVYLTQSFCDVPLEAIEQTSRQEIKLLEGKQSDSARIDYNLHPKYPEASAKENLIVGLCAALPIIALCLFTAYWTVNPLIDKNSRKTLLLQKAAANGDSDSMNKIGWRYHNGVGNPRSEKEAFKWYLRAAEAGSYKGQYNIGLSYKLGRGVKRNYQLASFWFKKSADQGFSLAQRELGIAYLKGRGVKRSYQQALRLFEVASASGDGIAFYYIGFMHEKGRGMPVSLEKAKAFYQKALDKDIQWVKKALKRIEGKL